MIFLKVKVLFCVCKPGTPKHRFQQNIASKNTYSSIFHALLMSIKICTCLVLKWWQLNLFCVKVALTDRISWDKSTMENLIFYFILWKCQQGRFPSRIYISPNKSLGSSDVGAAPVGSYIFTANTKIPVSKLKGRPWWKAMIPRRWFFMVEEYLSEWIRSKARNNRANG